MTVKKGRIEKTDKETYLGEWINSKGDNKIKIEKKKEKVPFMIQQIRKYGNYKRVGKMDMKVRMNVLDRVIMTTILYGMELLYDKCNEKGKGRTRENTWTDIERNF